MTERSLLELAVPEGSVIPPRAAPASLRGPMPLTGDVKCWLTEDRLFITGKHFVLVATQDAVTQAAAALDVDMADLPVIAPPPAPTPAAPAQETVVTTAVTEPAPQPPVTTVIIPPAPDAATPGPNPQQQEVR